MSVQSALSENVQTRFLVITQQGYGWIHALRDLTENVHLVSTPDECEKVLTTEDLDIILYDDPTFDLPAAHVVEEIHLQHPQALIAVISGDLSASHYEQLIDVGAVDAIRADLDTETMLQRISSLIRQSRKNRELAFRTRKLHATNLLSQKLHNAEHPTRMIIDAIELICNYFSVYGVAIAIKNDQQYQVYAGTGESDQHRRLYESKTDLKVENPLRHVIASKMSIVFPDITKHPFYNPIPVIKNPRATVIVPIKHGSQIIGSMALFAQHQSFTSADVAVFELLANNFGTAYHNTTQQHWREIDAQSMRYMLKVWPELNRVYKRKQIVEVIHNYILEIESVKMAGVWLFSPTDGNEHLLYSSHTDFEQMLRTLHMAGSLAQIQQEFESGLQPLTFKRKMDRNQTDILIPLYENFDTSQITVIPIASNSFEGMVFVISKLQQGVDNTDLSLIENLTQVTANVLERNTLVESIQEERAKLQEQTGRVEGVLRSIDEGIFFVDDSHQVVYCNPQFTELTNITPSQVLDKPFSKLFQYLASSTNNRQGVFDQLTHAAQQMQDQNYEETYPILEISSQTNQTILIEFMRVDVNSQTSGWIGVIGAKDAPKHQASQPEQNAMLYNMLDDMTLPLIELNNATMQLPQQYDRLSSNNFEILLQRLEKNVQDVQSMWGNFVQIYKGEVEGIKIRSTTVDPSEFLENLLANRMRLYQRQIRFDKQVVNALIQIDERQMRQCFINLIEFLSRVSNRGAPIFVSITHHGNQALFTMQEKTTILQDHDLSNIFTPRREDGITDELYPHRLGMYLAKQIVEAHGGQLSIENIRGAGIKIKLHLPLMTDEETIIPMLEEEEEVTVYKPPTKGLTMTLLNSQSNFLIKLYPEIEAQGHQIIIEERLDNVLLNLKMTKVDLILLEVDRANTGLVGQVQRIRAQSEVPIVIIALPDYEDECLQGIAHGADDYFIVPFNEEKLLAQLYAISKRQELAARTAEPVKVGNLTIDFSRRRVYIKDKLIDLTAKEYELLRVLVMNRGHVMTHKRLLAKVWGPEYDNETQYLWVNISRLRRKLEIDDTPRYIQNEPRVGYVFATDTD
ncbi:MAG: winged helix-turn-helix domain-containing protein [Anaerolineae bacterium]